MVEWVLCSWESVTCDTICRSFDVCGVTSCDPKVIHCTKEGELANDAHQRLENLMSQPGDDSEKDVSEDDAWSLTQGSDHEDGLKMMWETVTMRPCIAWR